MAVKLPEGCPAPCPLDGAMPCSGPVYRAVKAIPASDSDFLSEAELPNSTADMSDCLNWGLSVWTSEAGVAKARSVFSHFRHKRYILTADLEAGDGVILNTPRENQPLHHTLWKEFGNSIRDKFDVFLNPEPRVAR